MNCNYNISRVDWSRNLGRKTFFFLTVQTILLSSTVAKQYRNDYIYNRKTDAFYKLHTDTRWPRNAHDACLSEGAELMIPKSSEDVAQIHGMFKQYPDIRDIAWIASDGTPHESADDKPLINLDVQIASLTRPLLSECDVVRRDGEIQSFNCFESLPFFCKVEARNVFYDSRCKVYGKDYKYFENVGSCYKIPRVAFSWNKAYQQCHAENSHLVVLNSELEHRVVRNLTNEEPPVKESKASYFFFAGIRAPKKADGSPIIFKTIFNQTLEQAGYNQWSENEPNNAEGNEYCGSILKNSGKYNDINCADQYGFICEKEVQKTKEFND